ncbi:hypothetical protein SKAU_G00208100 [Synaphobranchus kaupii]|uniref:Uncharacterized protein n=1 Tax=Synaphobranchus kaupii TaxID=118154 RepID=A0A9Q1F8B3_SYNKA|nr:hypothetical protein SKAU_G00208100 [Synaphobranchus kaupii]
MYSGGGCHLLSGNAHSVHRESEKADLLSSRGFLSWMYTQICTGKRGERQTTALEFAPTRSYGAFKLRRKYRNDEKNIEVVAAVDGFFLKRKENGCSLTARGRGSLWCQLLSREFPV